MILPASPCDVSHWFDRELRPHEPALRAYLRGRFPALSDPDDIVQEAYVRVLRARETDRVRSPKALLFTVAKNLALDVFRRQHVDTEELDLANVDEIPVLREESSESLTHEEKLQLLEEALQTLPERCRQVIMLKRFHGLSYDEISEKLGISHNTISAHMTVGVTKCRDYLHAHGVTKGRS
jgi:RNA polymerase sigma factor (sigma-70 family)